MEKVDLHDVFPILGYENQTLISKEKGCLTIPVKLDLPEVYTLDQKNYETLNEVFFNIINTLGKDYILHKQDYFFEESYDTVPGRLEKDFMTKANEMHFMERKFLRQESYLYISLAPKGYFNFSPTRANSFLKKKKDFYLSTVVPEEYLNPESLKEFHANVESVVHLINESGLINGRILDFEEIFDAGGLMDKYLNLSSKDSDFKDVSFEDNALYVGDKRAQFYTLENLDQFEKERIYKNEFYSKFSKDDNLFPIGNLFSLGFKIGCEHIINQYIYIPDQDHVFKKLRSKAGKFEKFSSRSKDDDNLIFADQIYEFNREVIGKNKLPVFYHLNVMGFTDDTENFHKAKNEIKQGFRKLKVKVKENTIDRKNLFFGGLPGNAIGISSDMYLPMSSDMASCLLYYEGEYRDGYRTVNGMRLVDRITGRPLAVSLYKKPMRDGIIFNRGTVIASGSGGGKSYITSHYLKSELDIGSEIIVMEPKDSYDFFLEANNGVVLEHKNESPFTFNPFVLDTQDYVDVAGKNKLSENKTLFLMTLLNLLSGGGYALTENSTDEKEKVKRKVLQHLIESYYDSYWFEEIKELSFNTFFEHSKKNLVPYLKLKNIHVRYFDPDPFFFLLEEYYKGGGRDVLLNKQDGRITSLSSEKLTYFKVRNIIDNELLFPIFALMIMDLFTKKLTDPDKAKINKIIVVDEAWKALNKVELENYFNYLTRAARSDGGQPIFISQKVDDFIASEVIKNAIIVNSPIKIFLDMSSLKDSFDEIQEIMGLSNKQRQIILSANQDLPKGRKLRDVTICLGADYVKSYGVETSSEEKCVYESDPVQKSQIKEILKRNNNKWPLATKEYAEIK